MENNGFNWNEVVDFFSKKYVSSRAAFTGSEAYINNKEDMKEVVKYICKKFPLYKED